MKQFRFIILGLLCIFVLVACSDFLEEKSQDEVIPTTTKDYSELLLGYMYANNNYILLHALSDELQINERKLSSYRDDATVMSYFGCFTWQPDMWERENTLSDRYEYIYSQIMGINAVLDGVDDSKGSVEEKEIVKAGALALRAFGYYFLVNLFGEPYNYNKDALGVPLKLTSALTENGMARNTVSEVYTQIVKDLEEASDLFEKYPKQRGDYRINGTTVDILLSRVYLYMEEWDKAIIAANQAISTAEGLTDYTVIDPSETFYMTTYDHSEVEWLWGNYTLPSQFIISDELRTGYKEGDCRLNFWFDNSYQVIKMKTADTRPTNTIRISEAYLNRAEARVLATNVDISGALADLNELRRHRIAGYQNVTISDVAVLLEEIRKERYLELCFDWHRWFDLRRYGMPSISHDYKIRKNDPWVTYTLQEEDPLYTLPISTVMMNNNVQLEQNASANESERTGSQKL